ncbi:hypothetical protein Ciccas_000617 [Cichlidogyrus casuarinus]|uniref:DJ-1/PfpI domain-containing protein n=1 Tax=Cichlidogyrus casuarinus TaxID=1844966 RepID=A0ABD2QMF5_9PLAT
MAKTAALLIATGSEEAEAVNTFDILIRGGIDAKVVSTIDSLTVECSRKIKIVADVFLKDVADHLYDVVILPGGMPGVEHFMNNDKVGTFVKNHFQAEKLVAAICAAPMALKKHNIAHGFKATAYPSIGEEVSDFFKFDKTHKVLVDKNLITSQGPGTSFDFGLKILEIMVNKDKADQVAAGMLLN